MINSKVLFSFLVLNHFPGQKKKKKNRDKNYSSIIGEVNKTAFFFFQKTYFKPKTHKTITSN